MTVRPQEVEQALTDYYLGTSGGTGSGAVRYIDASRGGLGAALGELTGGDPVALLAKSCGDAEAVARVLEGGWPGFASASTPTPGFFRYLVLTCAVVSVADSSKSRNFGTNLAVIMGSEDIFHGRSALPGLWRQLADWCRLRREAGAPIREFRLAGASSTEERQAPLGNTTHLRRTYEIAFPTWRELDRLRTVLDGMGTVRHRFGDPFEVARLLCPVIESDWKFTPAMHAASKEFRRLYEARATLLPLHRFWGAVQHVVLEDGSRRRARPAEDAVLRIRLALDVEDSEAAIGLGSCDEADPGQERRSWNGPLASVIAEAPAWLAARGVSRERCQVSRAMADGAVVLWEDGFATWRTSSDPTMTQGRCLLLRRRATRRDLADAGRWLGPVGEDWELRGPLDGPAKVSLLTRLGMEENAARGGGSGIRIVDGVRVGRAWLGRRSLLPRVLASGEGQVTLHRSSQGPGTVSLHEEAPRTFSLVAVHDVAGEMRVQLAEEPVPGVDPLVVEKRLEFVTDAIEHADLRAIDASRWSTVDEIRVDGSADTGGPVAGRTSQPVEETPLDALLEAVYAGGARGWAEGELVNLVLRAVGPSGPSVWDLLRSLLEGTWLDVTQATSWRTRRWWLMRPQLLERLSRDGAIGILQGSAPLVIRRRFATAVAAAGGRTVTGDQAGIVGPHLVAAAGVDLTDLLAELRWGRADPPRTSTAPAPGCWPDVREDPARHEPVATWDMATGRFVTGELKNGDRLRLRRHRRAAGDRADLFTVSGGSPQDGTWVGLSRTAAILETYRRAGLPMFELRGDRLVRLTADGHLPLPVVLGVRARTLCNPGPVRDGGRWTYAYPADATLVTELRRLFGRAIVSGAGGDADPPFPGPHRAQITGRARARSGARTAARVRP